MKDFAAGFKATYHQPTARDRDRADNAIARSRGLAAADAGTGGRSPNLGTDWLQGDTPGGATTTPSFANLPAIEGGDASSSEITDGAASDLERAGVTPRSGERSALPTFARGAGAARAESDIAAAKAAILGNESGGRYNAMGPVTGSGDRAYGKYQVMGKNIPQWTQAAIGRTMTPKEFLNNPQAQEAVFERYFGDNLRKYGFDEAASIWFSGRKQAQAGNAKDVLGTTVPKYVRMARATYNRLRPVQQFADGGTVEALPIGITDDTAPSDYMSSASTPPQSVYSYRDPQGMGDIADAAVEYGTRVFRLNNAALPQADPQAQDGARAFAMNVGAARPEEVQQIEKTVDPEYRMSRPERQIAMYKGMYDYWMDQGEPEKAQRAVFAMSMAAKDAARTYGVVATQALKRGDTKIAADAIAKAYDAVPDGQSIKVGDVKKDGVTFEMHDINGNITDKGKMAINEMMRVATGMIDGTEFLKQWGQIRERTDKRGAELERRRTALEQFNQADGGQGTERDYVATLSPEKRKAFYNLDPRDQKDRINLHFKQLEQDRKQLNFQTRRGDAVDKREHDDAMKLFGMAVRQKNWETTRDQVMTNAEKGFALRERDLSDRMARFGESRDDKLKRWAEIDKRILENRQIRGTGGKPSVDERKQQAVETTADTALEVGRRGIANDPGVGQGPNGEALPLYGPTADQFGRLQELEGTVGAARTYNAQEAARKGQPSVGDPDKIRTGITEGLAKSNPNLSPEKRNMLVSVASHIARANTDVDETTAINVALAAGATNTPPKFIRDRTDPTKVRVQFGNTMPVIVGPEALSAIAIIRGGALRQTTGLPSEQPTVVNPVQSSTRGPAAVQAIPGATGNPDVRVERGGPRAMNPVEQARITLQAHELLKERERRERRRALDIEALTSGMPQP